MFARTPREAVNKLIEAINDGDIEAALALYEPNATLVVEPGKLAIGMKALRQALGGFVSLRPTLKGEKSEVIEAGDVALF